MWALQLAEEVDSDATGLRIIAEEIGGRLW